MNRGALAGTPWRLSSKTCPSSWTKIRSTKPIAKGSPQIHVYAAIETSIEAPVVTTLNFRSRPPNFRSRKPRPTIGAVSLAQRSPIPDRGLIGS